MLSAALDPLYKPINQIPCPFPLPSCTFFIMRRQPGQQFLILLPLDRGNQKLFHVPAAAFQFRLGQVLVGQQDMISHILGIHHLYKQDAIDIIGKIYIDSLLSRGLWFHRDPHFTKKQIIAGIIFLTLIDSHQYLLLIIGQCHQVLAV